MFRTTIFRHEADIITETLATLVRELKEVEFAHKQVEAWNAKARLFLRCSVAEVAEFTGLYKVDEFFDLPPDDIMMIFRIGHLRSFEDVVVSQSYISLLYDYYGEDPAVEAELQRSKTVVPYPE